MVFAAVEADGGVETALARLNLGFENFNSLKTVPYTLSISIGLATMDSAGTESVEDLMARADQAMYEDKRRRKLIFEPPAAEQVTQAVA